MIPPPGGAVKQEGPKANFFSGEPLGSKHPQQVSLGVGWRASQRQKGAETQGPEGGLMREVGLEELLSQLSHGPLCSLFLPAPVTHASPGKDRAPLDDSPAACEGPPGPGSSDPAEAAARALGARRVTPGNGAPSLLPEAPSLSCPPGPVGSPPGSLRPTPLPVPCSLPVLWASCRAAHQHLRGTSALGGFPAAPAGLWPCPSWSHCLPFRSEVPTEPLWLHRAVPPVLPLHRRRGLQPARRLQRGGPSREPVLKTGQREGQGLPLCPPRWPPARPPAPKAAVAGAGVCDLQPCLAPAHNPHPWCGHPLLPELYTSPRAEATASAPAPWPQPQDIPAAFAPEAHAGSLPGPGFAQAWTPTSPSTNMVLAGHLCLQSKQALVGGSLFCLSTEGSQKCRVVCR